MANMSYCRFENTLADLQDCFDALMDKEMSDLSLSEQKYRNRLVALCKQIASQFNEEPLCEHLVEESMGSEEDE